MTNNDVENRPATVQGRGDRLRPKRHHRLYWHLTALRTELESVASEMSAEQKCSTLIDFGCGNMPYRPMFDSVVKRYIGCDLDGNELADVILEKPNVLPFDNNTTDVVLSSQVLEHVESPHKYLREAYRVLRPQGLLILSTHGKWRYHPDPTDFWRWTCDGLELELTRAGFSIVRLRGVMGPKSTALQLLQDSVLKDMSGWLRPVYTRFMQWRIRMADKNCPPKDRDRDACVYVVIARKGE